MKVYDDYLRRLYRGGRPSRSARLQNRMSAVVLAAGIWPARLAALEVRGRRSGRVISFPVFIADLDGDRYLVSMLGERANWVRNLRAEEGLAVLPHGRQEQVRLEEVPIAQRAPILQRYLQMAPERALMSRSTAPPPLRISNESHLTSPYSESAV